MRQVTELGQDTEAIQDTQVRQVPEARQVSEAGQDSQATQDTQLRQVPRYIIRRRITGAPPSVSVALKITLRSLEHHGITIKLA